MIPFEEATTTGRRSTPIRELGLKIAGTVLEPMIAQFEKELLRARITRVRPRYYLSTEWGVPEATIAIAIPFYLVRPELTLIHAERACHVEGAGPKEILRYLRHEMGHVINYAYRLHERKDWSERFGPMARPYEEEYRPRPFSREFVHHLPGWYAQKHPDEDWSETFAVWMTPDLDWRKEYAKWPGALRKLEYCDRVSSEIRDRDPLITATDLDGDVATLSMSLEQFYQEAADRPGERVSGLDGMLASIFGESPETGIRLAVSDLLRRIQRDLPGSVYHWTGHLPERTRWILDQMAERADVLRLTFRVEREQELTIAVTSLVTALAMNWLHGGRYEP